MFLQEGQITKALSGFYYITDENNDTYQTRARGVFRLEGTNPLVGDYVKFKSDNQKEGTLLEIKPRKNALARPAVANIDTGVVITSVIEPDFSTQLLDRFLVMLEYKNIRPLIYISKLDIADEATKGEMEEYKAIYEGIGYPFITIDISQTDNLKKDLENSFSEYFEEKLVVFMGQSGAGKSRLLNELNPDFNLKTAETSKSLGRGRHTTRHVEIHPLLGGRFVDTPGFSSLKFSTIEQEELSRCFPEMWALKDECRFRGCLHQNEPNCAVKEAVETGAVAESRYDNYLQFLNEIQDRKPKY